MKKRRMNKVAKKLLDRNAEQSELFSSADHDGARRLYRAEHPTEIAVLKCMDGRLNLPFITGTEPGIVQPFRNIGGMFDHGWPHFGEVFRKWVDYALGRARKCLVLATYHYSKGDHHRGCAGHGYDTEAARAGAFELAAQTERIYGVGHSVLYPIVVGIETDEDTLVFHGPKNNGETLDLCAHLDASAESLEGKLRTLYPDMSAQMINDLLPHVLGNIAHIKALRAESREPIAMEHREQVIAVGRGFDWLHWPNKALIVGPYSPNLASPISIAGKVVLGNIKGNRINPSEGIVLMSAAVHRNESAFERNRAVEKARTLAKIGYEALASVKELEELMPYVHVIAGTVDETTRKFTQVEFSPVVREVVKAAAAPQRAAAH